MKNPYFICDLYEGAHKDGECDDTIKREQVCLSGGDIFDGPSLLKYYQNDEYPPWGIRRRKLEGEKGPEWVSRNLFEDEIANFMFEKNLQLKGLREMINEQRNKMRFMTNSSNLLRV
ncbi:hypothetical protein Tco_1309306 [Tanacetum coccineum]